MNEIMGLDVVSGPEALLRLALSLIFGFFIGMERDIKNKPIDFRAYMIVALASCTVAILGQELYQNYEGANGVVTIDLSRIISGTLTGIGFLGAGAIIKLDRQQVVGTATGASIWASAAFGLTLGFGFYGLATATFLCMFIVLVLFGFLTAAVQSEKADPKE